MQAGTAMAVCCSRQQFCCQDLDIYTSTYCMRYSRAFPTLTRYHFKNTTCRRLFSSVLVNVLNHPVAGSSSSSSSLTTTRDESACSMVFGLANRSHFLFPSCYRVCQRHNITLCRVISTEGRVVKPYYVTTPIFYPNSGLSHIQTIK